MTARTFPPPWTVTEFEGAFFVADANGQGTFFYRPIPSSPVRWARSSATSRGGWR